MKRIVVAMSGGVDSSVALASLIGSGHEVVGVTLRLMAGTAGCCAADGAARAARVAASLGVPHYVWDMSDVFERRVVDELVEGYLAGVTPNPCVACNAAVKFDVMLRRVLGLGFDVLATGHYARILQSPKGRLRLLRGVDRSKDQSYALYMLDQRTLGHLALPLGEMTKDTVRTIARDLGLATARTPESQDICFVPDGDLARFVEERAGAGVREVAGDVLDTDGAVVGRHAGVHHSTVGQRRGLGVATGDRRYVVSIDPEARRIVVGPRSALMVERVPFAKGTWVSGPPEGPVDVMLRYRGPLTRCRVVLESGSGPGGRGTALLETPAVMAAPGQAVVFYDGDEVLGGGTAVAQREERASVARGRARAC